MILVFPFVDGKLKGETIISTNKFFWMHIEGTFEEAMEELEKTASWQRFCTGSHSWSDSKKALWLVVGIPEDESHSKGQFWVTDMGCRVLNDNGKMVMELSGGLS